MSTSESFLVALLCITIVMLVLSSLFVLIKLFSFGIGLIENAQKKRKLSTIKNIETRPIAEIQPLYSAGELKLHNVDEPTAAMIIAIVSDESGIPLSELCFKSIKAIEN